MCQECDTQHNCICSTFVQKHFAQEFPKMDFQDQFVAINFGNISLTILKRSTIDFMGKKKGTASVLLTMVAKVGALYCQTKIFTNSSNNRTIATNIQQNLKCKLKKKRRKATEKY